MMHIEYDALIQIETAMYHFFSVSWISGSIRSIVSKGSIAEFLKMKVSAINTFETIDLIDPYIYDTKCMN